MSTATTTFTDTSPHTTSRSATQPTNTPTTQLERSAANRLRTTMAAVRLSFTWLGVRKTLAPEQRTTAARAFHADRELLSASKLILDTDRHPVDRDGVERGGEVCKKQCHQSGGRESGDQFHKRSYRAVRGGRRTNTPRRLGPNPPLVNQCSEHTKLSHNLAAFAREKSGSRQPPRACRPISARVPTYIGTTAEPVHSLL